MALSGKLQGVAAGLRLGQESLCKSATGRSGLCPHLPLQVLNNPTGLQQGVAPVLQWEVRALCLWARGV